MGMFGRSWSEIGQAFAQVGRTRAWHLMRRFRRQLTVDVKQGKFTLDLRADDPISRSLYVRREFESRLCDEALELIRGLTGRPRGTGTVLDVGANNGVISIGLIRTGQVARAIAVEPDPSNAAALDNNIRQNELQDRVISIHAAATAHRSELELELSPENLGDHRVRVEGNRSEPELFAESTRSTIRVRGDTLDNLLRELDPSFTDDICLVWIDVQGHEGHAFQGARELLARGVPVVSEFWPYGLKRSGMDRDRFCALVKDTWSHFYAKRRGRFRQYPTSIFETFFDEFDGKEYDNVIFVRLPENDGPA